MRYAVTLSTFGTVAHHGGRHERRALTLPQAWGIVSRYAKRGARRFGRAAPSFAATFQQVYSSHLAHAAHARRRGDHRAAWDHLQAARNLRVSRPIVERQEAQFGAPQRSGFLAFDAWGARGGGFPVAYAAGYITASRKA